MKGALNNKSRANISHMTPYKFIVPLNVSGVCHHSRVTAILLTYTSAGFVIGADGRRMDGDKVISDQTRKIYSVRSGHLAGAFAWSGNSVIHKDGLSVFDFAKATSSLLHTISSSTFPELVETFCQMLPVMLSATIGLTGLPSGKSNLLIAAYFGSEPWVADIAVRFQDGRAQRPHVEMIGQPQEGATMLFSGSKAIADQVWQDGKPSTVKSTDEAVTLIRNYIKACSENPSADADASHIGGHGHIGIVSPDVLKWVDLPPS